jgi:hypothetical protein
VASVYADQRGDDVVPRRAVPGRNHMHWPNRLIVNDALYEKLESEIRLLSALYEMFTVRLHQLGDFADEFYTRFWL